MLRTTARTRRAPARLLLPVVAAALVLLTACDPPFPSDDAFYEPPSPLPAGTVGTPEPDAFDHDARCGRIDVGSH